MLLRLPNVIGKEALLGFKEEDNVEINYNNSNNTLKVLKNNKELIEYLKQMNKVEEASSYGNFRKLPRKK